MKIIAQEKAEKNRNQIRKEVIEVKKVMVLAALFNLMLCMSNVYALVDQKSRNLVIAEQEYKGAQGRLLGQGGLMVKHDFEFLKGDLK